MAKRIEREDKKKPQESFGGKKPERRDSIWEADQEWLRSVEEGRWPSR
jgi:hypothetical protein